MGECRSRGRGGEASRSGRPRPGGAFREPCRWPRRQGHDRLHEPADLRRAPRRNRRAAPGLGERRRREGRDQGRHDRRGGGPEGMAAAYRRQDAAGTAGEADQGSGRHAQAGDRAGHVADRLRRAEPAHHVCGQVHAGARVDAGHRPRQPRVPRQAGRVDRGLYRHRTEPEVRPRPIFTRRTGSTLASTKRKPVAALREKHEIVRAMFHGFDYGKCLAGSAQERLAVLAGAIEWVLVLQQREAAREGDRRGQEARPPALRRRRAGALQGVRPRRRERRGACHPRGGGLLSDRSGGPSPRAHPAAARLPPSGTWRCSRS